LLNDVRNTPSRRSTRVRSAIVIVQIALTVVLLVAAGLVLRSFNNIRRLQLGFVPADVITMRVIPPEPKPSANVWIQRLLERVSALPDVESAGAVYLRPLALGVIGQETGVILEGQPLAEASARENPALNYEIATSGYFSAMRIPLRRGRLFAADDGPASPRVVLVGESTARRLWPGKDPIGQRVLMGTGASDGSADWYTIVGVVGDVRYRGIDDGRLDIYEAPLQAVLSANDLVIRVTGNPARVIASVQVEARRLDSRVVVDGITTMDAIVSRAIAPWRFSVWLFGLFASLAFVLATVGLFSLVALDVANRRHELAVRLTLGARPNDVVRAVLLSAGWRLAIGVSIGTFAAIVSTRAMRSLLFGLDPFDLSTYLSVLITVCTVVTIAAYLPARRAGAIDPLVSLRRA
jgi:predicted permease